MSAFLTLVILALALLAPARAEDAEALFAQGVQAYAAEDYDRAMKLFERATKSRAGVSRYHDWLGKAAGRRAERVIFFRAMGLAKKARDEFERAVELDPNNVEALNNLLDYYLQAPGFLGGGIDKAEGIAGRLARINPAEGHRARALILSKQKDYAGAERELRQALDLEPSRLGRLLELASFLAERGRYGEADALFDRAAELGPKSPEYLFARGQELAQSKRDPQRARQLLEHYLRSDRKPDDPPPSEVESLLKKL